MRSQSKFRCRVVPAWSTHYPALLAYAVPKGSPYRPFFFHAFRDLLESGALTALKARWKGIEPLCTPDRVTSLGFEKIVMVFLMVTFGQGLAVAVFLAEMLFGHCRRRIMWGGGGQKKKIILYPNQYR